MSSSMFDLTSKVAIVTGGTKGLGLGMAKALAKQGANIVISSRTVADCDRVAAEIKKEFGVETLSKPTDVSKSADIDALVAATVDKFGKIDILVNNAGAGLTKMSEDLTMDEWDFIVGVDLRGVFELAQKVGKQMIKQQSGSIINIASVLGMIAEKAVMPYLAAKSGVIHITKGLALEWAKYGIRVNAVAPGYVITEINATEMQNEKVMNSFIKKIPMRRFGEIDEIASAVVYLASDEASYTTGITIPVDGGRVTT